MKSKEFLSTRAVAKITGLSVGTIQKMTDVGIFSYYLTLGGHRRILKSSVDKYLKNRETYLKRSLVEGNK